MDNRKIDILFCFQRVWYRILTFVLISAIYTGLAVILFGILQLANNSMILIFAGFAYMVALIFIMNYLVSVVEVNILEQYRGINVFKRCLLYTSPSPRD